MTTAPGPIPLRTLLVLTAAVIAAHAIVVAHARLELAPAERITSRVFSTRVLQIKADAPASEAPLPRPAKAPSARRVPVPTSSVAPESPLAAAASPGVQNAPAETVVPVPAPAIPAPAPEPQAPASVARAGEPAPAAVEAMPAPTAASALPKDPAQIARNFAVPGSVRLKLNATGQASKMNYQARGELAWLHDGRSYEARLHVDIVFRQRVWTSTGRLTADGLEPGRYSDRFRSEQAAHFDRERGRISFSANTPDAVLLPGAQDQLSVFIQLAAMVAGEPTRYPAGSSILVQAVGPRAAESWVFVVEAEEKIYLPGGSMTALKLTRTPRREFDRKVELWLAPSLSYLPARILLTDTSGDFVDMQWRASEPP